MPNKYSYGSVLARYRNLGLISLPDELYHIYVGSTSPGGHIERSRANSVLSKESTRSIAPGSPANYPAKQDHRKRPTYTFTTTPSQEDRRAFVAQFINQLEDESKHDNGGEDVTGNDDSDDHHQDLRPRTRNRNIAPKPDQDYSLSKIEASRRQEPKAFQAALVSISPSNSSVALSELSSTEDYSLPVSSYVPPQSSRPAVPENSTLREGGSSIAIPGPASYRNVSATSLPSQRRSFDVQPLQRSSVDAQQEQRSAAAPPPHHDSANTQPAEPRSADTRAPQAGPRNPQPFQRDAVENRPPRPGPLNSHPSQSSRRSFVNSQPPHSRPAHTQHTRPSKRQAVDTQSSPHSALDTQPSRLEPITVHPSHTPQRRSVESQPSPRRSADVQPSLNTFSDNQTLQRSSVDVRSAQHRTAAAQPSPNRHVDDPTPPAMSTAPSIPRKLSRELIDVHNAIHAAKPSGSSVGAPTAQQKFHRRSRSSSKIRHQPKKSEDDSLPSVSDSVSETGVEVVDDVALSSDYDNGVKIPEHEAASIAHLPTPEAALPAGSIMPRQASPPPPIGSNETRKIQPRPAALDRSDTSRTQIYAPLSSTFPPGSSYTDEPAFIPKPNIVGPGSLPESAIERAPDSVPRRDQPISGPHQLYAPLNGHNDSLYDSSDSMSEADPMGMPSILSARPVTSKSMTVTKQGRREPHIGRNSLDQSRSARSYATAYQGSSAAARLNLLQDTNAMPRFPEAHKPEDFELRPVSAASDGASSVGAYPPDIARWRDPGRSVVSLPAQNVQDGRGSIDSRYGRRDLRREDSGMAGVSGSPSSGNSRRQEEKVGSKLMRRLRAASLTGTK